eukprot:TRINITY_DN7590_c0_g1_i1.p1 TRINITY_DN7590_c0_g1~~TRINITY_DN7590_c0_g1_i1.p1  ORF type:complete len:269 (+),score=56.48 TRINITY_DN7590_c0_g1_i1:58-807(+)
MPKHTKLGVAVALLMFAAYCLGRGGAVYRSEFAYVVDKRRQQPAQKKLVDDKYAEYYGVTCVMHLAPRSVREWGEPLYAALQEDAAVTDYISLTPPTSYRVTLRGLEAVLDRKPLASPADIAARFEKLQRELAASLRGVDIVMGPKGVAKSGMGHARVILMRAEDGVEAALRDAEQMALRYLPPSEQEKRQEWHLTIGYAKEGASDTAKAAALEAAFAHALALPVTSVQLLSPDVVTYRSMAHFEPAFN